MINIQKIKLSDLVIDKNTIFNENNKEIYEKLKFSIEKNGEIIPLICYQIDNQIHILDGKKRFNIYRKLGWDHCHCNILEDISQLKAQLLALELYTRNDFDVINTSIILDNLSKKIQSKKLSKSIFLNDKQIDKFLEIQNWDWSIFDHSELTSNQKKILKITDSKQRSLF